MPSGPRAAAGDRCLVVTTSYPRWPGDAAGCFVEARVRTLVDAGHRIDVLAAGEAAEQLESSLCVRVHRIAFALSGAPALFYADGAPERLEASPVAAGVQALRFWGGLVEAIRSRIAGARAIESHWLVPCGLAVACVAAATGAHRPHRAHAHSGDVALLERLPGGPALAYWLATTGMTFVFASADLRARFARLVETSGARTEALVASVRSSLVAPATSALVTSPAPPPTPETRAAARAALGLPAARSIVVGVGRLVPIKGYDVLIRAIGRLPAATRPTLALVGEGPERRTLSRMASDRAVDLRLAGVVPHAEVGQWLAAADLFAHPSRSLPNGRTEGLPVAVQEALAARVTVLAADSGGLRELADKAGTPCFMVKSDHVTAWTTALERNLIATLMLRSADS